ncbi:hypothetical protein Poli38472_003074 [Pythium oligandrum]|uniref:DET1- and DDB1-associated protein 1 domain-containing protein n=1 Tax=Pythium oligandrum TaxID=41045 RepID=A0A8K1FDQ2_PYTOL|nr:hypothetical protein Poli38472_003074 [Pythium oligandrum]|eukprot:TMW57149.1 hypothetical protein Poli38472_003074 [Pythium oligandrum]
MASQLVLPITTTETRRRAMASLDGVQRHENVMKDDGSAVDMVVDTKATGGARGGRVRIAWPSVNAENFTRLPAADEPVSPHYKMIRSPAVYYATHDTMPPLEQVIELTLTHEALREFYQHRDRKNTKKRENGASHGDTTSEAGDGSTRPTKALRSI